MAAITLFKRVVPDAAAATAAHTRLPMVGGSGSCVVVPNRTHLGYIARQGPSTKLDNPWDRTRYQLIKVNMKPVKRVHYTFDPFHPKVDSIRKVIHRFSCERIQKSNPKCFYKTEVVCDRSEPTMKIELDEGNSLLFKTANLSEEEIVTMINDYVLPRVKADAPVVTESKGAKQSKSKGKKK